MPRYRPGDHVIYHFRRPDLLKLQFRTGLSLPPFKVMRVLPPVRTANLRTKYNGLSNRMHASLESMNSRLPGEG